jgi:molybdopterin molybdotransferase
MADRDQLMGAPSIDILSSQRLPQSLTSLDAVLRLLLEGLAPVAPISLPLAQARGCVLAEPPQLPAYPTHDVADTDGWALRAGDIVGASSYSPIPLAHQPRWVETGDRIPDGCDCVLEAEALDCNGALIEVVAEAAPGQGLRRAGSDIGGPATTLQAGVPLGPESLLIARATGYETLQVRRPHVRLVNIPAASAAAALIAEKAELAGAHVTAPDSPSRDAASLSAMLNGATCDLLLTVGGTGRGRGDAAVAALQECGKVLAHGVALRPGKTAAIATVAGVRAIALPGSPDQALAGYVALVGPALDRLTGRPPRPKRRLPLGRKIASLLGVAELALLVEEQGAWVPLATGDVSLQAIARADAWLLVDASSEGFAAGTPVDAYLMHE